MDSVSLGPMYTEMHSKGLFLGQTWTRHIDRFVEFLGDAHLSADEHLVLDYGCGSKGGLLEATLPPGMRVLAYDPFVEAYAMAPWDERFDVFFSCDVLEHLPLHEIMDLLLRLRKHHSSVVECLYFSVSCRPANKSLPNGLNAHLTVHPASWWFGLFTGVFAGHYRVTLATHDLTDDTAVFGLLRV